MEAYMKHSKEQFVERVVKMLYHKKRLGSLSEKDKQYLDMLLVRDNLQYLYEENTKTKENN